MIAVTILTGFLGSGKTTLLNALMEKHPNTRFAIIENEIGETNIDKELIIRPEGNIFQMSNGCLCCTLNGDLANTLFELYKQRADFDHLLIETTGLALPDAVASVFVSEPAVQELFELRATICLFDALHGPELVEERETLRRQLSFADYILINKSDLVEQSSLANIEARLRRINPFAEIEICIQGETKKNLLELQSLSVEKLQGDLQKLKEKKSCGHTHEHDESCEQHTHEHIDQDIEVVNLHFSQAFDALKLRHWLKVLLMLQGQAIYRIKAQVDLQFQEHRTYLQSVQKEALWQRGKAWQAGEEKQSHWVFIGTGLRSDILERNLKQCLYKEI